MANQDRATRDIRTRLKSAGLKPLKYTVGIGKLFIQGSGTAYFNDNMPAAAAMYETNQDLLKDTVKFLRNPADAIKRQVDKALGSESFQAVKRLVDNAVDDLKTGNFYDAERDRTEFGAGVDALLDDFGGFDMDGFDENGDWGEIDVDPSVDADVKIAQAQEDSDAKRTEATISAVGTATEAIINNDNNNARDRLKMSVKQHSQSMAAMQNLITTSSATFEMMNNNMKVMTSVVSEASAQILSNMGEMKDLLVEIRDGVVAKPEEKEYVEPNNVFAANGALDIRAYLKNIGKSAKDKFNLDMISMATGGLSVSQLVDLYADNPWQLISDSMFKKLIPATLQKSIESFNKSLTNFFPALLTKLFNRGKDAENEGGSFKDMIAGLFGFKQRSQSSINPEDYDYLGKATITNKFVKSVEEVIPMWLSRIDSHISGNPLQQYNYQTGKLEDVAKTIAKNEHSAKDLVGRMGDSQYALLDRAEALQFRTDKEKDEFKSYVYKFLQKNAEENNFINPKMDKRDFKAKLMPTTDHEELYYNLLVGMLNSLPRASLMQMSKDIIEARAGRDRYNKSLNEDLHNSGLMSAFSGWLDEGLSDKIKDATMNERLGLNDDQLDKIVSNYNASNKAGFNSSKLSTNSLLLNIASTLKGGIITFSYDMNNAPLNATANPELSRLYERARTRADEYLTDRERAEKEERDEKLRNAERDQEQRKAHDKLLKISNYNGTVITNDTLASSVEDSLRDIDIQRMTQEEAEALAKTNPAFARQYSLYRDQIKDNVKNLGEKTGFNKFVANAQEVLQSPFKLVEKSLNIMDGLMFKFLYGDDMDVELAGSNEHYLISSMSNLFKAQFANIRDWFSEHIGEPLKKFLFDKDDGITSKFKKFFSDKIFNPIKETVLGKKNEQGYYSDGIFSDKMNSAKWKIAEAKSKFTKSGKDFGDYAIDQAKGAITKVLYGDYVEGKGKGFSQDVDDDGNIVASVEYGGIVGTFKKGFQKFKEFMLGPDWDTDNESKKAWKATKDEVKTALPGIKKGAFTGAAATLGMGLLGGLWLPGGPIMGAMLGSAAGFIKSSDKFKKWVFGEDITDDDGNVTHHGGLISKEVQEGFKKFAPKVAGGFAIGSIAGNMGLLPFGMGPIIGGILGSMGGMIAASDQMKDLIFGKMVDDYDDNGKKIGSHRDDSGLIPAEWQKNIKKALPSIGIGALGGTIVGGLIPGIAMLPGGPILGGLAGLAASLSGDKFNNFLFGAEEDETDDNGKPTGKKVRKGGVFGRMFNFGRDKIVAPFFKQLDTWGKNIGTWFQNSIVTPFSNSIQPFRDAMSDAASNIRKSLANIGQSIKDSINGVFEKFVGKPLGQFFEEKIINPMKNMLSKLFGGIGKFIGGIISAPFKAMEFIFTGKVSNNAKENDAAKNGWLKKLFGLTDEQKAERERKKREKEAHRANRKALRADRWRRFKETLADRFGSTGSKLDKWFHSTHDADGYQFIGKDGKVHYRNAHGGTPIGGDGSSSGPAPMSMPDDYSADPNAYKEYDNDYNTPNSSKVPEPGQSVPKKRKTKGQLRSEEKQRRKQMAKDEEERRAKANNKKEDNGKSIDERFKEFRKKKQEEREKKKREKDAKNEARKKLKDAKRSDKSYSAKSSSNSDEMADAKDKSKAKAESDKSNKKIGRKSDNDYLSSISKYSKKIADEISGQLGGTGWNLAYIKTLLEKKFGGLSSDELPDNMEGSTKKVKKKRGFFGKAKDAIGGFFGGAFDTVREGAGRVWDFVTAPFRAVRDIFGGIADAGKELVKGIGSFLGSLGGFLKDTLFKALDVVTTGIQEGAKTLLHTAGKVITGAVDFVAGAAKGLGATLGNLAATATGVLKEFALAATSVLGGVIKTIATVAPDVVAGLWNGLKGLGKGAWKGIKGIGGFLGRGAMGLFDKITGRDKKKKDKIRNIGTFKLAGGFIDTIKDGVKMMVGDGSNFKTLPFVSLAKGVSRANPSIAIPVYLAGVAKVAKKLLGDDDNPSIDTGKSDSDNTNRSNNTSSGSSGSTSSSSSGSNPSAPSATPIAPTKDEPKAADDAPKEPMGKLPEKVRDKNPLKHHKAVRSSRKMIPMSYGSSTPNVQQIVSGNEDWANEALLNETQEVRDYVNAYKKMDSRVSKAKNPKKAYDDLMEQSKTNTEIEALTTVKDLNDIGGNATAPASSNGAKEEKSSGLFDWFKNLLVDKGGGLLKSIGTWFGATKLGKVLSTFGKNAKGLLSEAGGAVKSTVLGNLPFLLGTYKAIKDGDTERVGLNVTKQLPKIGKWGVKSASQALGNIIGESKGGALNKINFGAKLLVKFRTALGKFLNNKVVTSVAKKVAGADMSKVSAQVLTKFDNVLARLGSESASKLLAKCNIYLLVATAVYDFSTGMYRASEYFEVGDDDVTWGMRFAAGLAKGISGIAFGLIPISWLSQTIYKIFASKETEAELKEKQDKLKDKTQKYNEANGTDYTASEFTKKVDQDTGYKKLSTWEKIKNVFTGQKKLDTSKIIHDTTKRADGRIKIYQKPPNDYKYTTEKDSRGNKYYLISQSDLNAWAKASGVYGNLGTGRGRSDGYNFGTGANESIFSQTDPRWNREDPTMKDAGCGPTVAAMMVKQFGRGVTNPVEASKMAYNMGMRDSTGGTNPEFFTAYGRAHGIDMKVGSSDASSIAASLNQNRPVALMGQGGAFGPGMHYMMANGMKNRSTVELVDPIGGKRVNSNIKNLSANTKTAIYGSGAFGRGFSKAFNVLGRGNIERNEYNDPNIPPYGQGWGRGASTKNGCVYMNQGDPAWGEATTVGGSKIRKAGCVITSMCMAISQMAGKVLTPADVCKNYRWVMVAGGIVWEQMNKLAKQVGGGECTHISGLDNILNAVAAGKPVLLWGQKPSAPICNWNYPNGAADGPHAILLVQVSSDKKTVRVNDPASTAHSDMNIPVSCVKGYDQSWCFSKNGKGIIGTKVDFSGSAVTSSTTDSSSSDSADDSTDSTSSNNTGLAGFLDKFDDKLNPLKGLTTFGDKIGSFVGKLFGYNDSSSDSSDDSSTSDDSGGNLSGSASSDMGSELKGGGDFPKYSDLTDAQKKFIAGVASAEQDSSDISAQRLEISQMANLNEVEYKRKNTAASLMSTLKGGWYAKASLNKANAGQYSPQALKAVDEVLVQGKRTLPRHVTEHDFYGDINNINLNPNTQAGKANRKKLKVGDTITNSMGSKYQFYKFAGKNGADGYGDPFGSKDIYIKAPYTSDKPWGSGRGGLVPGKMDATPYTANNAIFGKGSAESNTSISMRGYISAFANTLKKIRESAERDKATDRIVSSIENVASTIKSNNNGSDNETLTTLVSTIGTALGQMVSLLESIKTNTEQQVAAATTANATSSIPTVKSNNYGSRNVGSEIIDKLTSK